MTDITAGMVANLRAVTGLGMMECKKALVEAAGDIVRAQEILRIKSGTKASQLATRTAQEGMIALATASKTAALVEINCETDFMAKDSHFSTFAQVVAQTVCQGNPQDIETLNAMKVQGNSLTIEALRQDVMAKVGENVAIRRFVRFESADQLASYVHGRKIGVLVDYVGSEAIGHDIALHIAASKPLCLDKASVAPEVLAQEKRIYEEQALQSGKAADIVAKMVEGRVMKFLAEVTLLGQTFIKEPDLTVSALLAKNNAKVNRFAFLVVGQKA